MKLKTLVFLYSEAKKNLVIKLQPKSLDVTDSQFFVNISITKKPAASLSLVSVWAAWKSQGLFWEII